MIKILSLYLKTPVFFFVCFELFCFFGLDVMDFNSLKSSYCRESMSISTECAPIGSRVCCCQLTAGRKADFPFYSVALGSKNNWSNFLEA